MDFSPNNESIRNFEDVSDHRAGISTIIYEHNEKFSPLTPAEQSWFGSQTVNDRKQFENIIVRDANISLRQNDLKELRGCNWINDEIINSFASLLNGRNYEFFHNNCFLQRRSSDGSGIGCNVAVRPRTYMFTSHFIKRLTINEEGYDFSGRNVRLIELESISNNLIWF